MAEFSTRKITPTDAVKIPAVNENLANPSGYMENDELKAYMTNGLATSADVVAADTGIRGTADAYDDTSTPYAVGDPCIYENVVYICKEAITAPAGTFDATKWDESSLATLMAGVNANADAITSLNDKKIIRIKDVNIGNVSITGTGYVSIGGNKPSYDGYTLLSCAIKSYGSFTAGTPAGFFVDANGNYLTGNANSTIANITVRYIFVKTENLYDN